MARISGSRRGLIPRRISILTALTALACLMPRAASGTVGFAETHSRLRYNELAALHWIHPGDGCNEGKTCFFLEKNAKKGGSFRDLYGSLRKVSVPPGRGEPLVMGEWSAGGWFVYDLRGERYLVRKAPYSDALASWRTSGLSEPTLADAENLSRYFRETWASRLEGLMMALLLLSPLLVLSLPLLLLLLVSCWLRFRRTKRKSFLALAAALLLPTAVGLFLLIRILAVLPKAR